MERVNSNNILNISAGGGDNILNQDGASGSSLEAYTVVLSATAHVLSTFFGGGSSLAIIIAIITRGNINRYSYTLVITFLLACCSLNFIWSPMEMTDLIMFHYIHKHPCQRFVAVRTALHLFLILLISIIIVLLSVEGIIRMRSYFGRLLRKVWPLTSSVLAVVFLAVFFVIKYIQTSDNIDNTSGHYIIIDKHERFLILVLTVFAFCIVAITLLILALLFMKETVYWEDGRPRLRRKKMKLEIPQFLISQSNACANNESGYENSKSDTPSPTTPKLVINGDGDTTSIKGEDSGHISELPANMVKPTGNRLGINMAQVLGRRRHTICQITDSTSTIITPADHIARAKQYNYVRKFSVDISALQAQLQNPKIFRDAPYQSDIDLSRKQPSEITKPQIPKPLLPLKPLSGNLVDEERLDNKVTGAESMSTNSHPPPVIMVSNDDALSNNGDDVSPNTGDETTSNSGNDDIQKDSHGSNEAFHDKGKHKTTTTVQKPTELHFNESTEEHTSAPTLESAVSGPSDTESEGLKLTRLTILLCLTFVLNMLPVLVTELMESRLTRHAFINISTCTLAVSTIQTIVYPHLIASCDDVVHKAIGKFKRRVKNVSCCRSSEVQTHTEDSSSTGQL